MKEILKQLQEKYNKLGLSRTELAQELGISLATLDRMLANGDTLPSFTKVGRQYLFLLTDIVRFLEKQGNENTNKGKQMTKRSKRDIKTATREENMETNNVVFNIEKVKYTIEKARKNSRIPSEIVEMVQAPYQTYENMKYSADDNAPEVVKDFLTVLENNLMRAKDILEAHMRSKTYEDDGDKKSMLDNFEIINKDFEQTFIYLRSIEKDMMTYYSGKQPKNYGNYES